MVWRGLTGGLLDLSVGGAHSAEGKNILEFVGDIELRSGLSQARRHLFKVCEERVHPGRDEKVLTSWNGLVLAAFAEAACALDRDAFRQAATCLSRWRLWARLARSTLPFCSFKIEAWLMIA